MTSKHIYIKAATHISMQKPLCEDWMTSPIVSHSPYVRSQDPDFRQWFAPMEARRMGRLMKRALVTARKVMDDAAIALPDAIITGTGLGCIDYTEQLLAQLHSGETTLKPTLFMQSTHNTVSSLIAIHAHCHGYNSTYSQRGTSFDAALLDAATQLLLGDIQTALVTGNDELTPTWFQALQRTGHLGLPGQVPATEASVAMMLTTEADGALCRLDLADCDAPDLLVLGTNGVAHNDAPYEAVASRHPGVPCFHYKQVFGEGYSASALGLYAAVRLVAAGKAARALFVNHGDGHDLTFVTLSLLQ